MAEGIMSTPAIDYTFVQSQESPLRTRKPGVAGSARAMAELRSNLAQSSAVHRTNWRRRSVTGGKLVVSLGTFAAAGYVLRTTSCLAFWREHRALWANGDRVLHRTCSPLPFTSAHLLVPELLLVAAESCS